MKRILSLFILSVIAGCLMAQPAKSRVRNNANKQKAQSGQTVDRASLMFPVAVDAPKDAAWRRDIYRSLDLTKDENAPLYYPVTPQGSRQSLFTLLFRLLNTGKIPAYNYDIDGVENMTKENRMHFKDMLDKYGIYYEIDGKSIKVSDSDVPSAEVKSYYVKESSYYDQHTATYHQRIVAICPVLQRADDFSMDEVKYPLFWVNYDDVAPYLSKQMIMTSNVNNAAQMSIDDYFCTNQYKGKIYMTTNMQNKSLQQYCPTDSALAKEQNRIEKEMTDFESHIWAEPVDSVELARKDSIANAAASKSKRAKGTASTTSRVARRSTKTATVKEKKTKSSSVSSGASAPRVSVRRQRH